MGSLIERVAKHRADYARRNHAYPTTITLEPGSAVPLIKELKEATSNQDGEMYDRLILSGEKACADYINEDGEMRLFGAVIRIAVLM